MLTLVNGNYEVVREVSLPDGCFIKPLTANVSKMKLVCVNTSSSADSVVTIRPKTVGQYHTINISRSQDHSSGHSYIESPTIGSPYNTFQISVTGGTGSVVLSLVGYKE